MEGGTGGVFAWFVCVCVETGVEVGGCHSCRPTVDPVPGNRISQVRARRRGKRS